MVVVKTFATENIYVVCFQLFQIFIVYFLILFTVVLIIQITTDSNILQKEKKN